MPMGLVRTSIIAHVCLLPTPAQLPTAELISFAPKRNNGLSFLCMLLFSSKAKRHAACLVRLSLLPGAPRNRMLGFPSLLARQAMRNPKRREIRLWMWLRQSRGQCLESIAVFFLTRRTSEFMLLPKHLTQRHSSIIRNKRLSTRIIRQRSFLRQSKKMLLLLLRTLLQYAILLCLYPCDQSEKNNQPATSSRDTSFMCCATQTLGV